MKTVGTLIGIVSSFILHGQDSIKTEIDTLFSKSGSIEKITYKTYERKKIVYYDHGKVIKAVNYKNGQRDGSYECFGDSAKILSSANYENGLLSGPNVLFFKNESKHVVANYKNNKLDGTYIVYNRKGTIKSETDFKEGKREGKFITYYENGTKQYIGTYKNDRMYGERLCYTENGDFLTGDYIAYNDVGQVEITGKCINGKPEGKWKVYSGRQLSYTVSFKEGKPDGLVVYTARKNSELYRNGVFVKELKDKITN